MQRILETALISLILVLIPTAESQAAIIARAGFNDAFGINSNATPNSPYYLSSTELGQSSVHGRGFGEPGWDINTPYWVVGGPIIYAVAQGEVTYEGDGAMRVDTSAVPRRSFPAQSSGQLRVEQYVLFQDISAFTFNLNNGQYPSSSTPPPAPPSIIGPQWIADSDRHFKVVDGIGDGSLNNVVDTGLVWIPNTWYKIDMLVDISSASWQFSVNGIQLPSTQALGFVGSVSSLEVLEYAANGRAYVDAITLETVPEPTSLGLAAVAFSGLIAAALRRSATEMKLFLVRPVEL